MGTPSDRRYKVLVADDQRLVATTLHAILERQGYETALAFDGQAAVSMARTFKPDLLLSDLELPEKNGVEAAVEIVRELPSCEVLLFSRSAPAAAVLQPATANGLSFPVVPKPVQADEIVDRIRTTIRKRRRTFRAVILNVDDNDIQRYAVTRLLTHAGFSVREANTGAEALAMARSRPDLVLLDINLPDIDGFEVCKRLKALPETADIPVVHLTNTYRDDVAREKALSCGAEDFLTHPVQPDDLLTRLRQLITQGPNSSELANVATERNVLCLRSSPVLGRTRESILQTAGYSVKTAQDAHEALPLLHDGRFGAVLIPATLPNAPRIIEGAKLTGAVVIAFTTANEPSFPFADINLRASDFKGLLRALATHFGSRKGTAASAGEM